MDKIDLKIISLLQENARLPLKQIASEVFLSSPATAARIERLEQEGIIKGYSVKADNKSLGYAITAFINLEMQIVLFFSRYLVILLLAIIHNHKKHIPLYFQY